MVRDKLIINRYLIFYKVILNRLRKILCHQLFADVIILSARAFKGLILKLKVSITFKIE